MIKSRRMKWARHVAYMVEMRNTIFWFKNLKGRDHLEDLRLRWKDNIRLDLREIVLECVDWKYLAHDRDQWQAVTNMVMNLQVQ